MPWLARNTFTPTDKLHADDLNNLANDQRTWGGDVNGGGYTLSNVHIINPRRTRLKSSHTDIYTLSLHDALPISDKLHADDLNNLANDQRTWGGDVNGGGYTLSNVHIIEAAQFATGAVSSV